MLFPLLLKKVDFICLTPMNPLVLISYCWLLKKTLVITTNLTNPESASNIFRKYTEAHFNSWKIILLEDNFTRHMTSI